jgi:hypothetical protein
MRTCILAPVLGRLQRVRVGWCHAKGQRRLRVSTFLRRSAVSDCGGHPEVDITHWEFEPAFLGVEITRAIGVLLILAGVPA